MSLCPLQPRERLGPFFRPIRFFPLESSHFAFFLFHPTKNESEKKSYFLLCAFCSLSAIPGPIVACSCKQRGLCRRLINFFAGHPANETGMLGLYYSFSRYTEVGGPGKRIVWRENRVVRDWGPSQRRTENCEPVIRLTGHHYLSAMERESIFSPEACTDIEY